MYVLELCYIVSYIYLDIVQEHSKYYDNNYLYKVTSLVYIMLVCSRIL